MKALVYEGAGLLVPRERPGPGEPRPDEVLVKPAFTGLCFSEKHILEGWDDDPYGFVRGLVWGHEFGGVIEAVGEGVSGFEAGDRVTVDPRRRCGECRMCRAGYASHCEVIPMTERYVGLHNGDGGMAEYTVVPASQCYLVPDEVSDLAAALVEPLCSGTRGARMSSMTAGDNVVFFGGEDYTLSTLQWSRIAGASQRVFVDPYPARRAAAERMGATVTIDPNEDDPVAAIRDLMPVGADVVFLGLEDYVPAADRYIAQSMEVARIGGEIVLNRLFDKQNVHGSLAWLLFKELRLSGFGNFFGEEPLRGERPRGDYQVTLDMLASGLLVAEAFEPEIVDFWALDVDSPDQIIDVFSALPESASKAVLRIHGD